MNINQISRGLFITILLISCSFLPLVTDTVEAAPSYARTTFYFNNILDTNNLTETMTVPVTLEKPTNTEPSYYPPLLLKDNNSIIPTVNYEEYTYWLSSWTSLFFADESLLEEFFGGELGDLGEIADLFESMLILLPHPLRLSGVYTYEGTETVTISGDLTFDLFFKNQALAKKNDRIEVGLYKINAELPTKIKNTTIDLTTSTFQSEYHQTVTLENVYTTLEPDQQLYFVAQIIPGNKTISNLITNDGPLYNVGSTLVNRTIDWILTFENNTEKPKLSDLAQVINEAMQLSEGINISDDLISTALNTFRSTGFIYDSSNYPASVTIPTYLPGEDEYIDYYLTGDGTLTTSSPDASTTTTKLETTPSTWNSSLTLPRSKNIKTATLDLYVKYQRLIPKTIDIQATLYDGTTELATTTSSIRSSLLHAQQLLSFDFPTIDHELPYGHSITLQLALANGTNAGILSSVKLNYGSNDYPSKLSLVTTETDNINITSTTSTPSNGKIIPGGSVIYDITISSEKQDTITFDSTITSNASTDWDVQISPQTLTINSSGTATTTVTITSTNNKNEAYDDSIELSFSAEGTTGIDYTTLTADVSTQAIDYDVEILAYNQETVEADKGEKILFRFKIKNNNTGAIDDTDSYSLTVTSYQGFNITSPTSIKDITRLDTKEQVIQVEIPEETNLENDTITFTIESDKGDAIAIAIVNISIQGDEFLEILYHAFEDAAVSLGLNDTFGDDAPLILITLLILIIMVFIIILALLSKQKTFSIFIKNPIQDIKPKQHATYHLEIENTTKKDRTFNVSTQTKTKDWNASAAPENLSINGHQSKTSIITVIPPKDAKDEAWSEILINVNEEGHKKKQPLSILTNITNTPGTPPPSDTPPNEPTETKEDEPMNEEPQTTPDHIQIRDVFSWPKRFKENDRIITSFILENTSDHDINNIEAILYINGTKKNNVTLDIPANSYADVKLPWIAAKGKNKLYIKVRLHST